MCVCVCVLYLWYCPFFSWFYLKKIDLIKFNNLTLHFIYIVSQKTIQYKYDKPIYSKKKNVASKPLRAWDNTKEDKKRLFNLFWTSKADLGHYNSQYVSEIGRDILGLERYIQLRRSWNIQLTGAME